MRWWIALVLGVAGAIGSVWIGSTALFLVNAAVALFAASQLPGRRK